MGKQIRFSFEKGGSFVADMLEDLAPVTCKVIWDAIEQPWTEKMVNSNICGNMVETPYLPVPEDLVLPNENLWHFGKGGDVATVSPHEYREFSIRGYLPLLIVHGFSGPGESLGMPTIEHLAGKKIELKDDGDHIAQLFKKSMMETCRANVFAKVCKTNIPTMVKVCSRIRYDGIEGFTIERV